MTQWHSTKDSSSCSSTEQMPCFAQEHLPKLPLSCHCKSLSSLIRGSRQYAHCHYASCLGIPSSGGWSSDDDDSLDDEFTNTKQVILNEMRSRQMKKRSRTSIDSITLSSPLRWSFTPLDPRSVLETSNYKSFADVEAEKEAGDCGGGDGGESEAYFSVKSFFTRSTSRAATVASSDAEPPLPPRSPVAWEVFRHCEGWPFGLRHRAAELPPPPPPPPSSPADSWQWRASAARVAAKRAYAARLLAEATSSIRPTSAGSIDSIKQSKGF